MASTVKGPEPPDPVAIFCDHRRLAVYSLVFGPLATAHSNSLFSGHEQGWSVEWSLESRRPLRSWKSHEDTVLWTDILSANGSCYLFTQGREGFLKIWILSNGQWQTQVELPCASMIYCNSSLSGADNSFSTAVPSDIQSTVEIHKLKMTEDTHPLNVYKTSTLQPKSEKQFGMCMKLQFCISSKLDSKLLVAYESGHIALWDTIQSELLSDLRLFEDPVMCLTAWAMPLNSEILIKGCCGSTSSTLISFAVQDDILINNASVTVTNAGFSDACSRNDSKIFVTGGWDCAGRVFSSKSLKQLVVLTYHQKGIGAVTFSQDKLIALGCRAGYVTLWHVYNK